MNLSQKDARRIQSLYGPWAVVTGASSGIGREIAQQLAAAGMHLVLAARSEPALRELAQSLGTRFGIETRVIPVDLATREGIQHLTTAVAGLDAGLLVASAGFGTSGRFMEADLEEELNMLQVNCAAVTQLVHHFGKAFRTRKRSGIVLLSSIVAWQGVPLAAHYSATKAYVQNLAEGLAIEFKPYGIDVLAAAPAQVISGFAGRAGMTMGAALRPEDVGVPILKALGRRSTVLPGFLSVFLTNALRTLPRWGKIRVMQKVMAGMVEG